MLKWQLEIPKTVAEDSRSVMTTEAKTLEDAIIAGQKKWPHAKRFHVTINVEIVSRPAIPLENW